MRSKLITLLKGGVQKILFGSLIGQGMLLAVSPVLTRLYSPAEFGALSAFTAFATVLGGVATMSWERGIVIPRSDLSARALARLGVATAAIFSAVVGVVLYLTAPVIDRLLGVSAFADYGWLLPLTTFAMGLYAVVSSSLVRSKAYARLGARNAVQGSSQAISSIVLGLVIPGPIGLLSGILVGRVASVIGVARWRRRSRVGMARTRAIAKRYRRFPLVATWSRALNSLGLQLPALLIVALYGPVEAGLYALTIRVLATPIGIVVDAVSQYFEGTFAELVRTRAPGMQSLMRRIVVRLALLAVLPTVCILIFGPAMFGAVFGEQWRVAGTFAQITVVYYAVQFVVAPVSRTLLVLQRQFTQLAWDACRMTVTAVAVLVPGLMGAELAVALWALAASQIALYAVLLGLCWRAARAVELGHRRMAI